MLSNKDGFRESDHKGGLQYTVDAMGTVEFEDD